jgi:hypothetical protein
MKKVHYELIHFESNADQHNCYGIRRYYTLLGFRLKEESLLVVNKSTPNYAYLWDKHLPDQEPLWSCQSYKESAEEALKTYLAREIVRLRCLKERSLKINDRGTVVTKYTG